MISYRTVNANVEVSFERIDRFHTEQSVTCEFY